LRQDDQVIAPRRTALAVAVLLALLPTACGSSDEDGIDSAYADYCATMKKYQDVFADDGTGLSLVTNIAKLKKISADSPDDLTDEWQTFLSAIENLDQAITSVGLKPTDFVDGKPPAGISTSNKVTIQSAADRLGQEDVIDAATGIEQQAKDVCKLQLGL
jgi:hypothetical protein